MKTMTNDEDVKHQITTILNHINEDLDREKMEIFKEIIDRLQVVVKGDVKNHVAVSFAS